MTQNNLNRHDNRQYQAFRHQLHVCQSLRYKLPTKINTGFRIKVELV